VVPSSATAFITPPATSETPYIVSSYRQLSEHVILQQTISSSATELKEASTVPLGDLRTLRESHSLCHELIVHGRKHDFTWGFRIYRTAYTRPNADAEFNRAIEILHEHVRADIFYDLERSENSRGGKDKSGNDTLDDGPEQQLWKRLKNEIVQDKARLDGASPATLNELHHEWLDSQGVKTWDSCLYRYFVIFDQPVIDNLLALPPPEVYSRSKICIKVFDAEFGVLSTYFDNGAADEEESDDDEDDDCSTEDDGYEGWFWTKADSLKAIWFEDGQKERHDEVYTWDEQSRPVHLEP
jgi:hypothetical protein